MYSAALYESHTPPVEDFLQAFYRGSNDFKRISPLDTSIWHSYPLCGRFNLNIAQRVHDFQMIFPHYANPLFDHTPTVNTYSKFSTGGVRASNGTAHLWLAQLNDSTVDREVMQSIKKPYIRLYTVS